MADPLPPLTPYLYYENVQGALDWLRQAFGFQERADETMRNEAGVVVHAAMDRQGAVVMLGFPGPDFRSPRQTGHVAQSLYVYVEDVDAHHRAAVAAGAEILAAPEDTFYGDRRYGAIDLEGHHWYFAQGLPAAR